MGPHCRARALEYLAKAECIEIQPAPRLYRLASYKLLCALDNQLLVSTGLGIAAYRTKRSMQPGAALFFFLFYCILVKCTPCGVGPRAAVEPLH